MASSAMFRFKLEAQGLRIVISNKLQRALPVEMLKKLEDDRVTDMRFYLPHVDHSLAFG